MNLSSRATASPAALNAAFLPLIDGLQEAVWLVDAHTRCVVAVNTASQQLLGLPARELIGASIESLASTPEDALFWMDAAIGRRETLHTDTLMRHADGRMLWGELFTVQPFGNSLVKLTLTGQQVYDLLNQQFTVNRFLQISGLTYTWDNSLPAASRVVEVRKDAVPIDRAAAYTVTANNFIATGGDGFSVFLAGTGNIGGPIDLDALIEYVASLPQPFSAPPLDRIQRLN